MKKKSIYIIALFLIAFAFLMPSDVLAKGKKIGTCTYSLDVDSLGLSGTLQSAKFDITVYTDGTVKKGKIKFVNNDKSKSKEEATLVSGVNLDGTHTLTYKKMFDKNGSFYKAYKKLNNCPSIQFINQDSYGISAINMVLNGNQSTIDNANQTNTPDSTDPNSSKRTPYCENREMKMRNVSNGRVYFSTYETNGVRTFSVVLKVRGKVVGSAKNIKYNNTGNINYGANTYNFLVNPSDYDTYWSDKCPLPTTKMFMKADGGYTSTTRIIQSTRPSDVENGSYNAAEAKYDTGELKTYTNNATLDGLNQEYDDCSQLIDTQTEGSFGWLLQKLLNYIKIAGPILVVLLSALDFIKAIASSEEDAFKKAQSRLIIRLVAALALFLVPTFVELLLGLINGINDPTCGLK